MKIGIIGGTGREGTGLAQRWARAGHDVAIGSRDAAKAVQRASELSSLAGRQVTGGDNELAVQGAEVVVLAVPWGAHAETLRSLAPALAGRIVVDITVPLVPPRVQQVTLPEGQSAALIAQQILGPTTRVVAALEHVSSAHLSARPGEANHAIDCDVLVCADDEAARATVMLLVGDLGLRALDAGVLKNAIALEALTPVLLHINKKYKTNVGIRITGIPASG